MAIPLPGAPGTALLEGLQTGSGLLSRMMQPTLDMQRMALAQQQLGLQQEMAPYQRQLAEAQANRLRMEYDPQAKLSYMQRLMGGARDMASQFGGQSATPVQPMVGEGMGAFAPQGEGSQAGQDPRQADYMMRSIMMGLGLGDPWAESPLTKMQREIETSQQKEQAKQSVKRESLAPSTIATHQALVSGVDTLLPELESLKEMDVPYYLESPWGDIGFGMPANKAAYESKLKALAGQLVTAEGKNLTDKTLEDAVNQLKRGPRESFGAYKNRIDSLADYLKSRRIYSQDILSGKVKLQENPQEKEKGETLNFNVETGEFY